jgi:hypothetical protein
MRQNKKFMDNLYPDRRKSIKFFDSGYRTADELVIALNNLIKALVDDSLSPVHSQIAGPLYKNILLYHASTRPGAASTAYGAV